MSAARDPLLFALGLCARARKLVTGTPMVCEALRKGGKTPILAVLEATDTSDNTHGKLTSKCAYYKTPLYRIPVTTEGLAHAIGKTGAVAAVGVTDAHLLDALARHLPPAEALPPSPAEEPTPDPSEIFAQGEPLAKSEG